jgi:hypothetical protein
VDGPSNEARNCGSDFNLVRLPRSDSDLDLSLEELRVELKLSKESKNIFTFAHPPLP